MDNSQGRSLSLLCVRKRVVFAMPAWIAAIGGWIAPALLGQEAPESTLPAGFLSRVVTCEGMEHSYWLFVPRTVRDERLVVYLHDAGAAREGVLTPVATGLGSAVVRRAPDWPLITVMPEMHPSMRSWSSMSRAIDAIVEDVRSLMGHRSCPKLIGTGVGVGAVGVMAFARKDPDKWSSVLAVGGGEDGLADVGAVKCPMMLIDIERDHGGMMRVALAASLAEGAGQSSVALHMPGASGTSAYEDSRVMVWLDLASASPALACALVDGRGVKSYELAIVVEETVDTRATSSVTEFSLRCMDRVWYWSVRDVRGARSGKMSGATADEWARLVGVSLYCAGATKISGSQVPRPLEGLPLGDVRMSLRWRGATESNSWDWNWELPFGSQWDERLRPIGSAVRKCQTMLIRQVR
jgi:hypothetical protein